MEQVLKLISASMAIQVRMLAFLHTAVHACGRKALAFHTWLGRGQTAFWTATALSPVILLVLLFRVPGPGGIEAAEKMPVSTLVYDLRDRPVFSIFKERRTTVDVDQISPYMLLAVLAVEDQRFFQHQGFDVWRIAGAAVTNARKGEFAQGGSTITQQLARRSFLSDDKTLWRKAREIALAMRLEWSYSKREILQMYLNRIYFGRGFYGIEAAAQGYFGEPALALTLEEAALLTGLIKAPSAYAPPANLDRALARRQVVLNQMHAVGAISKAAATSAAAARVKLRRELGQPKFGEYFRNHVAQELVDRFGEDRAWNGGLRVFTTIDPTMQRAAERALTLGLTQIERRKGFDAPRLEAADSIVDGHTAYLQGAFVAIDPRSGAVRALVGGRNFDDSTFDRVVDARRQAGSAYKPFVFAAALEAGATPATRVTGLNQTVRISGGVWRPDNAHGDADDAVDSMTMRQAMRTSNNRAAVQVLNLVGLPTALNAVSRLGLAAPPPVPSMVLGSGEVSLLSMTTAYGAFANAGVVHPPVFVRRVETSDGVVIFQDASESHTALSPAAAFMMADMLADVVDRGTGAGARAEGFKLPAGGKTGTTNDYKDAWFVGFTPTLVAGVWAGFDTPRPVAPNGYAAGLVVPIWARFMRDATAGAPATWVQQPNSVVRADVCIRSGLTPTDACPDVTSEYFHRGSEPDEACDLHEESFFERLGLRKAACRLFGAGC
jgi:penicillin-binding protein 1A